ncbi:MAG: ABC transporter ATP-binding protein [Candidatus Calescibacterium sp.]|nr:ABC transporter ATP-binding protein [Candidatus Calescibacterium sp.]MDW8132615.1 ABC transporter ATP-binding protein [Candidatus Calescibacterium sp.]
MKEIVVLENVTKKYGNRVAIQDISVSFEEGKITGFLGLNGAGKTTTMKIITTYFKPNSGKVYVDSLDVSENPYRVRKLMGYLPENFPIYDNLTILDFLRFVALAKDVEEVDKEVERVIELVGIKDYKNRFLRELSKGYKQRVGIAQAIIGNPKVIILDEPTQGLDPAQIIEIRKLIKDLSHDKTIILSTHIMQEVEAICDNVAIIHKGRIKMSGKIQELKAKTQNQLTVEYLFDQLDENKKEKVKNLIQEFGLDPVFDTNSIRINIKRDEEEKVKEINKKFYDNGLYFLYVNRNALTMENLFLEAIKE